MRELHSSCPACDAPIKLGVLAYLPTRLGGIGIIKCSRCGKLLKLSSRGQAAGATALAFSILLLIIANKTVFESICSNSCKAYLFNETSGMGMLLIILILLTVATGYIVGLAARHFGSLVAIGHSRGG